MPRRKREKTSRSEMIRAYKREHADAGPKAIAEALTTQGVAVTPAHVSTVLSAARSKARLHSGSTGIRPGELTLFQSLVIAKQASDKIGGISRTRDALNALAVILS